jgi:hypothetical protein
VIVVEVEVDVEVVVVFSVEVDLVSVVKVVVVDGEVVVAKVLLVVVVGSVDDVVTTDSTFERIVVEAIVEFDAFDTFSDDVRAEPVVDSLTGDAVTGDVLNMNIAYKIVNILPVSLE